ncbi:MAG TPA: DUF6691 family protein [Methylotenera sp.]|nr:DUF6691 family protein [Methylotenera sp.]
MALIAGLIFGLGLIISGMTSPSKVIGFLDLFGAWDPSLAFTMLSAILVSFIGFRRISIMDKSILGNAINLPLTDRIDNKLILGSMIFGIGWGLVGYCPGPALTSLMLGNIQTLIFTFSMIIGMLTYEFTSKKFA